jgi:aminoglycoside 6'-N-acetyltransferase
VGVPLHTGLTTIRGAREDDVDLLVGWHADPDISRFWDDETFTRDEMLWRLRRPGVDAFVVEAEGKTIGYIQAWSDEEAPLQGGIDMFLVPEARGRGLGPNAASALARHLREDRGWTRVTVDPYEWNEPAIRAWRKAGFSEIERRPPDDEHRASWVLMCWDPG